MKRSEINAAISEAKDMIDRYSWVLPKWGYWSKEEYNNNPNLKNYLKNHQMGWDVTDFGKGEFEKKGITLFCIRNGIQGNNDDKPYAEKLLFMSEFLEVDSNQIELNSKIDVLVDGEIVSVAPKEPLILKRGQSVTVERNIYHKFYSAEGSGMVMAGEVSQVNDDNKDNYFLESVGRFTEIEEDEVAIHPLWNEI